MTAGAMSRKIKKNHKHNQTPIPGQLSRKLWREDYIYDVIIPLGYNDVSIIKASSAIFMHVARPEHECTEGRVALALPGPPSKFCVRWDADKKITILP